jgi:hypothetical protein
MVHAWIPRVVAALALLATVASIQDGVANDRLAELPTTPIGELWLHADRWSGKDVAVEGQVYKFPGNRVTSGRVLDQVVCDRISRFRPRSGGECMMFTGLRVQNIPGARRSADGGLWTPRRVRLAAVLREDACGVPVLDVSRYWGVPL